MKTSALTLLMALLGAFALQASPDSTANVRLDSLMNNYTATHDSVIQRMDVITAKVDSVHTQIKSESEKNWFGWDIDMSNVWIAAISMFFAFGGFIAAVKTAINVQRASSNVQKGQFDDLIRHLYRNLVCTLAFTQRIVENRKEGTTYQYPSEEHLLKLKVLPEDVLHLESYNHNYAIYKKMHELKLQLRNYDTEIETAMMHLKDSAQNENAVINDLDTLTFKPLFLIDTVLGVAKVINKKGIKNQIINLYRDLDSYIFENAASIITSNHIENLSKNYNQFKPDEYLDLNALLQLKETGEAEENEKDVKKPYNGLGRSYNRFFKAIINANKKASDNQGNENSANLTDAAEDKPKGYVEYGKRFDNEEKYTDYSTAIKGICGTDEAKSDDLSNFRDDIINKQKKFPFKQHFLTILSIDATIELSKIHMIETS